MQTIKSKDVLNAELARVAQVLVSEDYNLASTRRRDGVVSAEYHLKEDSGQRRLFEIRAVEHKRTMTGSLDRTQTENSRTEYIWDADKSTLAWDYISPPSSRMVRTSGIYTLRPVAGGTELHHEVSVDVNVPLIGNKFAKLIAKEFEKAFPDTVSNIKKYLG